METNLITLSDPTTSGTHIPCALQIKIPDNAGTDRTPVHFVLVIDISDSMSFGDKLSNVKHSANLILPFLGPSDRVSLITFGDGSTIESSNVVCSALEKSVMRAKIDNLTTDGCTNLSAALISIKQVLAASVGGTYKTGTLILTDGHANRGAREPDELLKLLDELHETYPSNTIQFVGYGTDHNSGLLKTMAEHSHGTYSMIESKDSAATLVGDTLGSLFSCALQLVKIVCPPGTRVHGQYTLVSNRIEVGDLYSGTETIILVDILKDSDQGFVLEGTTLPKMETIRTQIERLEWDADAYGPLRISVELTKLRYECSSLFEAIRDICDGRPVPINLKTKINSFKVIVNASRFDGNVIGDMLREEAKSLSAALAQASHRHDAGLASRITQHQAYVTSGRGVTMNMDPTNHMAPGASPTPMASSRQRRVRSLVATMSIGGDEGVMAQEEAQMYSQVPQV